LPVDRSGGSVAAFTHLYMPLMHRQGFVAPNLGTRRRPAPAGLSWTRNRAVRVGAGARLQEPVPSIIRTFLIDPVGLIEGLQHPDDSDSVPVSAARVFREPGIACRPSSPGSPKAAKPPSASTTRRCPRR
jgi:hypothetical protein